MIDDGTFVIGRGATADIVLNDETVGRKHAEIVVSGGKFFLADVGSKNGTYQLFADGNEVPFNRGWVSLGDRFAFGRVETTVANLLGELPAPMLHALGVHDQVKVAARRLATAVPVAKEEEKKGRRVRCMTCGNVVLASEPNCSACNSPRIR